MKHDDTSPNKMIDNEIYTDGGRDETDNENAENGLGGLGDYTTFPDHEFEREGHEQEYIVTLALDETDVGHANTWSIDNCTTPDEAAKRAARSAGDKLEHIYEVEPRVERVEFAVAGTSNELAECFDGLANVEETTDAMCVSRDPEESVRAVDGSDRDDSDADVFEVTDWGDVVMETIGIKEALGAGDGMSVSARNFAHDDSTVEFHVGEKVVAKVTKAGGDNE